MTDIWRQNLALQKRLDVIKSKGTGISNLQELTKAKSRTPMGNAGGFRSVGRGVIPRLSNSKENVFQTYDSI